VSFGSKGAASYTVSLFAGTYDILLIPENPGLKGKAVLPELDFPLEKGAQLQQSTQKSYDL